MLGKEGGSRMSRSRVSKLREGGDGYEGGKAGVAVKFEKDGKGSGVGE